MTGLVLIDAFWGRLVSLVPLPSAKEISTPKPLKDLGQNLPDDGTVKPPRK